MSTLGRREVIGPARAELHVEDGWQHQYAEALARLGEPDGFAVLAQIYRRNVRVVDALIPESWIVDILDDIATPEAERLLEELLA